MKSARRIFFIAAATVSIGFWGYSALQDHAKEVARREERDERRQALGAAVAKMASRVNATTDWAAKLAGVLHLRTSPILSAELQEVWTPDRPILFVGRVQDIVRNQDESYQLKLDYDFLRDRRMLVGTDLRINLRCPASFALPLLNAMKSHPRSVSDADVATIAVVDSIASTVERDGEGNTQPILTGAGRCVDVLFLSERLPR